MQADQLHAAPSRGHRGVSYQKTSKTQKGRNQRRHPPVTQLWHRPPPAPAAPRLPAPPAPPPAAAPPPPPPTPACAAGPPSAQQAEQVQAASRVRAHLPAALRAAHRCALLHTPLCQLTCCSSARRRASAACCACCARSSSRSRCSSCRSPSTPRRARSRAVRSASACREWRGGQSGQAVNTGLRTLPNPLSKASSKASPLCRPAALSQFRLSRACGITQPLLPTLSKRSLGRIPAAGRRRVLIRLPAAAAPARPACHRRPAAAGKPRYVKISSFSCQQHASHIQNSPASKQALP